MSVANKILRGLEDAVAGNFAAVTIEGQRWVRAPEWLPINADTPRDRPILVIYEGRTRVARYGKTSHVPLYGFCLADQGPEDFDLVDVSIWQPLPEPPVRP